MAGNIIQNLLRKNKPISRESEVIRVSAAYTSQRCPKCGRIRKENRDHARHGYVYDQCGYRSNDDRVGAMNIYQLGIRYLRGEEIPAFSLTKM